MDSSENCIANCLFEEEEKLINKSISEVGIELSEDFLLLAVIKVQLEKLSRVKFI